MNWEINSHFPEVTGFSVNGADVQEIDFAVNTEDSVELHKDGKEFVVKIKEINDDKLHGQVVRIGPTPVLTACGITRNESVVFERQNIFHVYKSGGKHSPQL